ncbi:glycosyltransferase [Candidatus Roizmanbacteria bacterium]|nr:glycosyltransferase [Candidatus Roizmanbacteria bacterium]
MSLNKLDHSISCYTKLVKKSPLVSIIITTKNEEKNLGQCLKSLTHQKYQSLEIIVVDNNSSDTTKEIARTYTSRVYGAGPERSGQRNLGAKKALGKYLLFLDADMRVSKNLIGACVEEMERGSDSILRAKSRRLVGLYIKEVVTGNSYWNKVRNFERSFYDGTVIDGLRFFRRDSFLKIGGYDERLYACEDWDLDKRIKKLSSTGFITKPLYHDESDFTLRTYLNKKGYYSLNFKTYIDKWGRNDDEVRKQFSPSYRLLWVFIENGKWKKLLSHLFLALGMFFLRILVGLNYLFTLVKYKMVYYN